MSIYYKLVNTTKKEYIDLLDLGMSNSYQSYEIQARSMLGYLMITQYPDYKMSKDQYNEKQYNEDMEDGIFFFLGHWYGDRVKLANEHSDEYGLAVGYLKQDKDGNIVEIHYGDRNINRDYIDITIPLAKEMNDHLKYRCPDDLELFEKYGIKDLDTNKYI